MAGSCAGRGREAGSAAPPSRRPPRGAARLRVPSGAAAARSGGEEGGAGAALPGRTHARARAFALRGAVPGPQATLPGARWLRPAPAPPIPGRAGPPALVRLGPGFPGRDPGVPSPPTPRAAETQHLAPPPRPTGGFGTGLTFPNSVTSRQARRSFRQEGFWE